MHISEYILVATQTHFTLQKISGETYGRWCIFLVMVNKIYSEMPDTVWVCGIMGGLILLWLQLFCSCSKFLTKEIMINYYIRMYYLKVCMINY